MEQEGITTVPAPEEDAIEMDELCIRVSPSLWLWIAVSRLLGQIVGFAIGGRTDAIKRPASRRPPLDTPDKLGRPRGRLLPARLPIGNRRRPGFGPLHRLYSIGQEVHLTPLHTRESEDRLQRDGHVLRELLRVLDRRLS